jgi:hypothetical protein
MQYLHLGYFRIIFTHYKRWTRCYPIQLDLIVNESIVLWFKVG